MKTYALYLKSHSEQPDYEEFFEGNSFEEALDYFMGRLGPHGWETDVVSKHIQCDDECDDCHTDLEHSLEYRDSGYYEEVWYCKGCGNTETRKGRV